MIFQTRIGEFEAMLDDEITDQRPTPEQALDYLTRCAQITYSLYLSGVDETAGTETD